MRRTAVGSGGERDARGDGVGAGLVRAAGLGACLKDQGRRGGCWAFSATGALEGAYQIATGELRSLSEQQLIECSKSFGNFKWRYRNF